MEKVFEIWPTCADMARDIASITAREFSDITVRSWKRRGMIPAKYDRIIVQAAEMRGGDLTLACLAEMRAAAFEGAERGAA